MVWAISLDPDPKELILGEWESVKPEGLNWDFSETVIMEGNSRYHYQLKYNVSASDCNDDIYTEVFKPDQLVLIKEITENLNLCYIIDFIDKSNLVLFSETHGKYFSFNKIE
ncbi:hypothetical protein ABFW99_000810 [Gracilimonas sp. BCB1]